MQDRSHPTTEYAARIAIASFASGTVAYILSRQLTAFYAASFAPAIILTAIAPVRHLGLWRTAASACLYGLALGAAIALFAKP